MDWVALKRLGRYLLGKPRVICDFRYQATPEYIVTEVDSDWAGCTRTRRSTHGGTLRLGKHVLKHWSSTQATVALSSGEAEFSGLVRGASIALGAQALARDLGLERKVRVRSDSTAALGIADRTGLGKVRHLAVHLLWVQGAIRDGRIEVDKIPGKANPADLFTKFLPESSIDSCMDALAQRYSQGRAESAPAV